ncbi:MAG: nicotinate (nicotinamide) nucleotide adenylyltransferase [Oscillospiraceae bacterium]|nr:nicotinate (nicotinamide) nucleotide adenylyltransferase [Oscillospiraceae bacterium]
MKIGFFGGSFNPPHNGHIQSAKKALDCLCLDLLLLTPAWSPPHKVMPPGSPEPAQRSEMCRIAADNLTGIEVCELEIEHKIRYTVDTVNLLQQIYRPDELWLCLGGDMFLTLQDWAEADKLMKICRIAVFSRTDREINILPEKAAELSRRFGACIRLMENPVIPVSSTWLREKIPSGAGAEHIPPGVWEYIQKEKLYEKFCSL